jgi:hypothetical protein
LSSFLIPQRLAVTQQSSKNAYIITGYQVDTASVRAAIASNEQYIASLKGQQQQVVAAGKAATAQAQGAREALEDLSLAYADIDQKNALQKLAQDAAAGRISTEQLANELSDLGATRAEIAGVANEIERIQRASRDAVDKIPLPDFGSLPGERVGRNAPDVLHGLGNAAIALPGVGYQSPLVVGLRAAELAANKTGASMLQVGVAGAVLAAGLVAVAIAADQFTKGIQQAKVALGGALSAQQNYYDAVANLTTRQVQDEIAKRKIVLALQQQQAAELQTAITSAFAQAQATFGDATARALDAGGQLPTKQLREQYDTLNKSMQENEQTITRYTQGIDANTFAANDATQALLDLADLQKQLNDATRKSYDEEAEFRLHAAELRRTGTSDAVNAEIQGNRDRLTLIDNFLIPALKREGLAYDDLVVEAAKLEFQNKTLAESVLPVISSREQETQAIQDQLSILADSIDYHRQLAEQIRTSTVEQVGDRLNALREEAEALRTFIPELEKLAPTSEDAARQLDEARKRLGQISDDYADQITRVLPAALARAYRQLADDLVKIRAESQRKIEQIEAERGEKEQDAQRDRDKAYVDAQEKRDDALNKLAEDQAAAREKIERKANADIANAVFARNALAAYMAQKQKEEDLADLKKDGEKRAREIEKQFDDQKRLADRRYREQLDAARQAADKAIALERQRARDEINERVKAYNEQIAGLRNFNVQGTQYVYDFVNNTLVGLAHLVSQAKSMLAGAAGAAGGGTNSIIGGVIGGSGIGKTPNIFTGEGLPPGYVPMPKAAGSLQSPITTAYGMYDPTIYSGMPSGNPAERFPKTTPMDKIYSVPLVHKMLQNAGGGGLTVNVPVIGTQMRKRDIQRHVAEKVDKYLTDAGWSD